MYLKLGIVVLIPALRRLRQENSEFKANLDYIARLSTKQNPNTTKKKRERENKN
jgi:hypothetical protein